MNIAIIGFGTEGQAAYDYWSKDDHSITICDQKTDLANLPEGVQTQLGDGYLRGLERFDIIVRSPFVRPDALIDANSVDIIPKITSNTNEFMRVCPSRNIIGVTGTKGKGTTSSLITAILRATGKTVHLGGNIGVAALNLLKNNITPDDWVVLELSSYQLIDLEDSPHIAACLMVVPEHLDWHDSLEEYYAAKQQLFRRQNVDDFAVYYSANPQSLEVASAGEATKIPYFAEPGALVRDGAICIGDYVICETSELSLLGEHNWQNVCAAITVVWQITQDVDAIKAAVVSFKGLPFRIELRKEVNGIRYFNDSFAVNPASCMAAMDAIAGPKVMILGGFDRGLDLTELAKTIVNHGDDIRQTLLIGASKERLADALRNANFERFTLCEATTMLDIVNQATSLALPNDAVVLSPAFASFDLFKNFEDRGRKFNDAVEAL